MGQTNLANEQSTVDTSNDSIVIVDNLQSIRGGRSLVTTGFVPSVIPGGHVIIKETATGELKPMPATNAAPNGVATVDTLVAGTGYTNGTYENVPLSGGSGTGVLATVVVALTVVSTVTITKPGTGYVVNDTLTVPGAYAGGTATTNATVDVATLADVAAAYGALPAGHTYEGINISSILTAKPMAGIMVRGTVNPSASVYSLTSILTALKAALPRIDFRAD
ncbi:MAG: hypothetical protein ABIT05_01365 [Chitinophagaceae bacterium]